VPVSAVEYVATLQIVPCHNDEPIGAKYDPTRKFVPGVVTIVAGPDPAITPLT
jgi:hypothetical protein